MSSFIQDSQYNPNARGASYLPPRHTFSFPLLKTEEIAKCLNELGIPIRQEELQTPDNHIEACRRMLESLAEICTGIQKEEMAQPSFVGLQTVIHPELHEESFPKLDTFRAVCKMMEICEIPDFTIKDLMSPTAARLRRHLSGIINFAKFREERLLLLSDLSSSRETLVDELNQLRGCNDTLNNRLSLLREQTAEETSIVTRLETECREIEGYISQLNKLQSKLKEETSGLKGSNTEMKEVLIDKAQQLEDMQVQKKQMGLQIVSSPEKFRKQIVEVGQTLQTEQKDCKAAEKKVRELSAWLSNVDEAQVEVRGAIESVTELRGEVDRQKVVMADLENQRQTIVARQAALSEVELNTQQLQRHGSRAEEKLQHLRKQVHMRGSESQQAIDDLHKQLIEAEAFRLQVSARVERQEGEAERLDHEIVAESRTQESEIEDITSSYQRLERVVVTHLKDLQRVLEVQQASPAHPSLKTSPNAYNGAFSENVAGRANFASPRSGHVV